MIKTSETKTKTAAPHIIDRPFNVYDGIPMFMDMNHASKALRNKGNCASYSQNGMQRRKTYHNANRDLPIIMMNYFILTVVPNRRILPLYVLRHAGE